MRVNIHANTSYSEYTKKTTFEVEVYVHDGGSLVGHYSLHTDEMYSQQPDDKTNLNLWAVSALRGLVARMEEEFVYTDDRPPAVLIEHALERKKKLWCRC